MIWQLGQPVTTTPPEGYAWAVCWCGRKYVLIPLHWIGKWTRSCGKRCKR